MRSLVLASGYLAEAGDAELAQLRADQARAIADAYDIEASSNEGAADVPGDA